MPVPDFQTIMLPLLKFTADGQEHSIHEAIETLAKSFGLSESDRAELLPSGKQTVFDNRVGWARSYLKKANLLEYTKRTYFRITKRGLDILSTKPGRIDVKFLQQFPEFVEFQTQTKERGDKATTEPTPNNYQTPDETLEESYQKLQTELAQEIISRVKNAPPDFFERLVVELLVRMGYGGSMKDAGRAVGKTGDGGIDGIIKEDRLGLDVIYIQAKRWQATVGRPEIQQFVGALGGHHAKKGVFLTTSTFSRDAREYAERVDWKIVLIDGQELAQLMIDHNVGVAVHHVYEIKRIESDYFPES